MPEVGIHEARVTTRQLTLHDSEGGVNAYCLSIFGIPSARPNLLPTPGAEPSRRRKLLQRAQGRGWTDNGTSASIMAAPRPAWNTDKGRAGRWPVLVQQGADCAPGGGISGSPDPSRGADWPAKAPLS